MRGLIRVLAVAAVVAVGGSAVRAEEPKVTPRVKLPVKVPGVKEIGPMLFKLLDTNKDGKISKDELAKYFKKHPKLAAQAAKIVAKLDTNKDGFISKQEFMAAGPHLKTLLGAHFPDFAKKLKGAVEGLLKGKVGDKIKGAIKDKVGGVIKGLIK